MTVYQGVVRNGVVVFDQQPPREGTRVRVEPQPVDQPTRGSPRALLEGDLKWAGDVAELDELLTEVQRMRDQDVELQRRRQE